MIRQFLGTKVYRIAQPKGENWAVANRRLRSVTNVMLWVRALRLDNITAGVREREGGNRTREAGHLDEIQGVVANTLGSFRNGAVGFIDWLGLFGLSSEQFVGYFC